MGAICIIFGAVLALANIICFLYFAGRHDDVDAKLNVIKNQLDRIIIDINRFEDELFYRK